MIKTTSLTADQAVISQHEVAEVRYNSNTKQHSLHTMVSFSPGDAITDFRPGELLAQATYLTVQVGRNKHITLLPDFLQYVNHSCDPNVFFDTTAMKLVCLKPLKAGDELRFFYPSTEWDMSQPFVCNCGSSNCLQLINGASHLSKETLAKYRLSDFIQQEVRKH